MKDPIKPGWYICVELDSLEAQLEDTLADYGETYEKFTTLEEVLEVLEDRYLAPYTTFNRIRCSECDQVTRIEAVVDRDAMEMDFHDNELLAVNDTSEIPSSYQGCVIHTNDHGNQTLYQCENKVLTEIWAVV